MTYLRHHGIKGQKWGVRNGPPYPIEDKILPKGTNLNSVQSFRTIGNEMTYKRVGIPVPNNDNTIYTFNPNDKWDSKIYRGPFSTYLAYDRGVAYIKEYEYVTTKDLKMPTKEERLNSFKELYNSKDHGKIVKKELGDIKQLLIQQRIGNLQEQKDYKKINVNRLKTDKQWDTAYSMFNHAMERRDNFEMTKKYYENMSKKYDAMVDDNNQGTYNKAHDPVIVFRADRALKKVSERTLSADEILKNYNDVSKELEKEGIRVKR